MFAIVLLTMLPFIWFGMIAAISFIETPLKFKAPGMTHALGVGIGRLVFKVLNLVEAVLAVLIVGAWTQQQELVTLPIGIFLAIPILALALQMVVLRPAMAHRTKALSHTALTHSGNTAVKAKVATVTHIAYIGSELLKAIALPIAGILLIVAVAT
ncbi:hypothetical protein ART_1544 [Arthrobacter sp. PAMC 25486]|uniref:hypothetical protein n=1 Tax=Arthrobacter sp. PAMC 25486 TaxID=1494608 RepID=UPI000535E058|nr:hypothetical protein [Arthrobacter sp. PAMC 25486]AIY01143.1 hypothetical protein ART_1544 [Arthrobacter sp. PAMC 25486]